MASNMWQLEEHEESCGSRNLQVTILASEWGSSKGGLSTLNRELAIQLAKFSCIEVTFFLPRCSDKDKEAAVGHGISILEAKRRPGYRDELDSLCFPPENLRIDVVVGHGVKLGHQAQVIQNSHKCKWVQVVHSDPEELGMFKCYENPIATGEEKEVELCLMADFVVGVGPKLAEAFRKYLGFFKSHEGVFEFTPGIFEDFFSVQQVPDKRKECSVLVFGRGDDEDFKLKGFDIAAKSVAALADTVLVVVGAPHRKHEEIAKRFVDFGIPEKRLRVRGCMNSLEALKQLFCEVDLVLMPSRTEGFGLTGLEAMSAGLPVIVSKNSGFGKALGSVRFGSFFVVDSEDPSAWTAAIKGIWSKDRKSQLVEVKVVQDSYGKRYSWSKQCKGLIKRMFKLVEGLSPHVPCKTKRGIEKNESEQPTGHSSHVPSKRKKRIEKNETAQLAGHSSRAPPRRRKGIQKKVTAQPAASDEEEDEEEEEEEGDEEEDEEEEEEDQLHEPTKKKEKTTGKVSKPLEDLVNDASDSLEKICNRFDTRRPGLGNYEDVAKYFCYDVFTVRSRFETSSCGPSKALILAIIAEHPDLTVESFARVVENQARRKDVVILLREFDRK